MMLSEHVRIGLTSVRKSRFRSLITILGIVIGVVSVVTIVSLGEGLKRQISGQVADLGTNLITVQPGKLVERDETGKISSVNLFASNGIASVTDDDLKTIRRTENVKAATALRTFSALPTYNNKAYQDGVVIGSDIFLDEVIDHEIEFGTYFQQEDLSRRTVVIGPNVAEKMFNEAVPIGKSLKIKDQDFTVQGVFRPFTDIPISSGINLNNAVFISEDQAARLLESPAPIYQVLVKVNNQKNLEKTSVALNDRIKKNHFGQQDFTVLKQNEVSAVSDELLQVLTRLIIGMAGITLFVGGIGIMNVMLVSVSERTREIGIRKAIGATNRQIRSQFLMEAVILSVWGALLGVVISGLLNLGIRIFTELEPVLTWQPIVVASGVSIIVGIVFGVIPAIKASSKDPIESFRPNS